MVMDRVRVRLCGRRIVGSIVLETLSLNLSTDVMGVYLVIIGHRTVQ